MAELKEVPTEELLSFQDYPSTHATNPYGNDGGAQINLDMSPQKSAFPDFNSPDSNLTETPRDEDNIDSNKLKSFWSIEYFQQFFDVDTQDVQSRILGSIIPARNALLQQEIHLKPDLYGPFWIAVTLVFTIAISGNIVNYLQYHNDNYHWRYDFHLVSYAASIIFLYITLVPVCLWGLLKWSLNDNELEEFKETLPGALELICIYGYSLFVYIPAGILWTIQIGWLQWLLVLVAASVSGSVLLFTLSHSLKNSRHKIVLGACIGGLHLLLAAGFMLFFFHVNDAAIVEPSVTTSHAIVKEIVNASHAVHSNNTNTH
ncbi:protein YIPF1 [Atheta coriaria]|uniref:protein YIPF1 n=1 Tax=Dalotia coriaria TaxID=877792 RepID=UPI0031F34222